MSCFRRGFTQSEPVSAKASQAGMESATLCHNGTEAETRLEVGMAASADSKVSRAAAISCEIIDEMRRLCLLSAPGQGLDLRPRRSPGRLTAQI